MRESSDRQLRALAATPAELGAVLRGGFETAIADRLPAAATPLEGSFRSLKGDGFTVHQSVMTPSPRAGGAGSPARVPAIGIVPAGWKAGPVVVWVHERGKQAAFEADGRTPSPEVKRLLAGGAAVLAPTFPHRRAGTLAAGSRSRTRNYFGYQDRLQPRVFASASPTC